MRQPYNMFNPYGEELAENAGPFGGMYGNYPMNYGYNWNQMPYGNFDGYPMPYWYYWGFPMPFGFGGHHMYYEDGHHMEHEHGGMGHGHGGMGREEDAESDDRIIRPPFFFFFTPFGYGPFHHGFPFLFF